MSLDDPASAWIRMLARDLSPAEVGGAFACPIAGGEFLVGALWSLTRVVSAEHQVLGLTVELSMPGERDLEVAELDPGEPVWVLADVDDAIERALDGP